MAETVHDSAFFLPSEFLTDADFLPPPPPALLRLSSSSALTSPGDSVVSSDTSNDDPDEFIAELTRHLALSALRDNHQKSWGAMLSNSRRRLPAAYGEAEEEDEAWEVIYAAAERAAKIRISCQAQLMRQQQPTRGFLGAAPHTTTLQFQKQRWLAHQHHQQQQQQQQMGMGGVFECGGHPNSNFPAVRNPHLHLHLRHPNNSGAGMRTVVLGSAPKKQSSGTGVFLPRTSSAASAACEPRKKQGCSTVVVPARVVQALNTHHHAHSLPPPPTTNHDILVGTRNGVVMMMGQQQQQQQQRRGIRGGEGPMAMPLLPQEWTY